MNVENKNFLRHKSTLLCSGPMSKNCIDASIELAESFDSPQILIASRRQIDDVEFGGGYVEGFTTEQFSQYVRANAPKNVYLARDHGGPWQSELEAEQNLSIEHSMASAKRSFCKDIEVGFDFIHIDPSIPIGAEDLTLDLVLDRLFELYGYCEEVAKGQGKNIQFELGTEEQNGYAQDLEQFEYFLNKTFQFCHKNNITKPTFVVAQTGTKVMEMRNVGNFSQNDSEKLSNTISHIRNVVAICNKYGIKLKEHNTDYLSDEALMMRPWLGIHASNVAPEYGVAESKALFYLLENFGLSKERDRLIEIALGSQKWQKWMLPNSSASDLDKATICCHYVFNHPEVKEIKRRLNAETFVRGICLNTFLRQKIKNCMLRYMALFNQIDEKLYVN